MADSADWLADLASSRLAAQRATSVITRDIDGQGRVRCSLQCRGPQESSSAVAHLLLSAFVEATGSSSRAPAQQGMLPRGIEISLPPAGSGGAERQQQQAGEAAAGPLRVQFTATDPAAEERVEEAARLFEASQGWKSCLLPAPSVPGRRQGPGVLSIVIEPPFNALAGLLQAYWQYHLKAAKSDLHCRMRQRLTALRQQLALTKFDGL